MLMIQDRNLTSHTYNRAIAVEIGAHIREAYLSCFQALRSRLHQRLLEEGAMIIGRWVGDCNHSGIAGRGPAEVDGGVQLSAKTPGGVALWIEGDGS